MTAFTTMADREGHPTGGPLVVSGVWLRGALAVLVAAVGAGCSAARSGAAGPEPEPGAALARPLEIYRALGFITGTGQFPAVASFSSVAGPADSTYVVVGMSIPNSGLRFLREPDGFRADYSVELLFMTPDSAVVRRVSTRQVVRVPSFAETSRTDESVIFQQATALVPGRYIVRLSAADANSARGFGVTEALDVPAYGSGGGRVLAPPIVVYEASARPDVTTLPGFVVNPRSTVAYGGTAARLYIEAYAALEPVAISVVNEAGEPMWSTRAELSAGGGGAGGIHSAVVEVPADMLPLGRFWIEVVGPQPSRRPLLMTISDQWMVANFEDVLQFLRYIAHPEELEALRAGTAAERRAAWESFWEARDPLPVTGVNEFREQFFQRVRYATEAFREAGRPGWQSHRGEVYIVLGPPDRVVERYLGRTDLTGRPNAEEWVYASLPGGRLNLVFHDRSGVGRLTLLPNSASAFRSAAERLRPRQPPQPDG